MLYLYRVRLESPTPGLSSIEFLCQESYDDSDGAMNCLDHLHATISCELKPQLAPEQANPTMSSEVLIMARDRANDFAKTNLSVCAGEVYDMNESGVLKPDGKVRELAKLCASFSGGHDPVGIAVSFVMKLSLATIANSQRQQDFDALWLSQGADGDSYSVARTWFDLGRAGAGLQVQSTTELLSLDVPGVSARYCAGHPQGVIVKLLSRSLPILSQESVWIDFNRHALAAVLIAWHLQPDHPVFNLDDVIATVSDLLKLEALISNVDKNSDPHAASWLHNYLQAVGLQESTRFQAMACSLASRLADTKRVA